MKLSLTRSEAEQLSRTIQWVLAATRSTDEDRNSMMAIFNKINIALKFPNGSSKIEFEIEK